ncbi:tRNA(Ser) Um(44) 2'-O-methyltransferase [Parahypoxylon ruwenzoriense]
MSFEAEEFADGSPSLIEDSSGARWVPLFRKSCGFNAQIFLKVMMNFIRNPNINSSWLFRADILVEQDPARRVTPELATRRPAILSFRDMHLDKALVRKLIPRNTLRDQPLDQTCLVYHGNGPGNLERSMVVYKPHVSSQAEMPFYHPKVQGMAFLHEWSTEANEGTVSIHYHFFDDGDRPPKLVRTGLNLLAMLHKHGEGTKAGYVKRVHHDTIIPQASVQTTYTRLKQHHARRLIKTWVEVTDPSKHVFEDLSIAAFLIELWAQMYQDSPFPGFVDIGCGNGLLVHILRGEGYSGWGFDARKRKSWENYSSTIEDASGSKESLRQHVLLPSVTNQRPGADAGGQVVGDVDSSTNIIHDGLFPRGTFIISNHADELTPWTPILATISDCPFIMIPCCSFDLSGARFRAPAPKTQNKSSSAYSSLVEWITNIGTDCGWEIETEMLRIPSTRNTGLIGRKRSCPSSSVDIQQILAKYGNTKGYADNVMKLVKSAPRGH